MLSKLKQGTYDKYDLIYGNISRNKPIYVCYFLECGAGFTGKLEGMFKDIDLSRDIMMSFQVT